MSVLTLRNIYLVKKKLLSYVCFRKKLITFKPKRFTQFFK